MTVLQQLDESLLVSSEENGGVDETVVDRAMGWLSKQVGSASARIRPLLIHRLRSRECFKVPFRHYPD